MDIAIGVLSRAEQRLEVTSGNVANIATPGYKAQVPFEDKLNGVSVGQGQIEQLEMSKFTRQYQGAMKSSGGALDLAISGEGMFKVLGEHSEFLTRDGRFSINDDGLLVDVRGLQVADTGGRAINLTSSNVVIEADGLIVADGLPVAKIGIYSAGSKLSQSALGGSLFIASEDTSVMENPMVRQGMLEGGNVELASEMINMMEAIRFAEAGSQFIQTYDQLMGQVFSTFGGS